jgi:ABC-type uncharacterized transport system fused permease/ATPase subunit
MMGEVNINGVFVPTVLIYAIAAAVLLTILRRFLTRIGFYRIVWHGPLVNVALYILILAAITAGLQRCMS